MGERVGIVFLGNIRHRASDGRAWQAQNVMASGGLAALRDYLASSDPSLAPNPPTYIAYGSGTAPVSRFLTAVPGETYRTPIVQRDSGVGAASVTYHWFVLDTDNLTAGGGGQTVGCYALIGGNAGQALGTGTVIAIANEPNPFAKDPTLTYAGDWNLTVSGVVS